MEQNVFHALREHMINMRLYQVKRIFPDYSPPTKIVPKKSQEYKAPREIDVFTNRMARIIRMKEMKKGISSMQSDEPKVLSRKENQNAFESLMQELEDTDANANDFKNNKLWHQLTVDEKKEKLVEFASRFTDKLNEKNILSLGESLKKEFDRKILEKNNLIKWSKKSEKIYEIKGLHVGENSFYWE